ncbi:hypothetical protein BP6252_05963 [Coleophoma cylindrospora]|uniref:Transcription factor domain-containing protein n=1 Tax=Coleophoma cylindrospora TaxID=1849047 RepID=A0A3D8RLZ8_9HELO|nr:hypothetical protein BP6252_05963 [Coleophoma cylindrospora]
MEDRLDPRLSCMPSQLLQNQDEQLETERPRTQPEDTGLFNADGLLPLPENEVGWESGFDSRHVSFITENDISWLFDDNSLGQLGTTEFPSSSGELGNLHSVDPFAPDAQYSLDMQDFEPWITSPRSQTEAPSCGFRVCNALNNSHRAELIEVMKSELPDVDFDGPMFTLNNLKQGIHLYARNVTKEYPVFNRQIFAPCTKEEKAEISEFYGEELPIQVTWAVITLGWTLLDNQSDCEKEVAAAIQGVLRKFVINVGIPMHRSSKNI